MINTKELLDELIIEIKGADWSYEMSDDYSAYLRGLGQCESIKNKMNEISFDQDDISYLKLHLCEMRINPTWKPSFVEEYINYWSKKVDYLTNK